MIVCLDTNVLVQARAAGHEFFPILDAWVAGKLTLAVSTPILLEYEEVIARMSGREHWQKFARLMDYVELTVGATVRVTPQYRFQVINDDPDDNIFTDCAITAGADYIVTQDRHFAPLATAGYQPKPINPIDFISKFL
ncbi:MAG: putative toxin-antitoxin system toxin component, PIN family [Verrucomicrobiaceae bacterium]